MFFDTKTLGKLTWLKNKVEVFYPIAVVYDLIYVTAVIE